MQPDCGRVSSVNRDNMPLNNHQIHFSHPEWVCVEAETHCVWLRGWGTQGDETLDAQAMARQLAFLVTSPEEYTALIVKQINDWRGNYAFCIATGDRVILGTDIVRSIPVLYAKTTTGIIVSDSMEWIRTVSGINTLDVGCAEEFLVSGFVFGNGTLYAGIKGLQAGEIVELEKADTKSYRHFSFNPDRYQNPELVPNEKTYDALNQLLLQSIRRMITSAKNVNRWVIPLSGGYDSRIIAAYLHHLGVMNVVCFTYGRLGNEESAISKQVAEALGYDWHFVEYNHDTWTKLMAESETTEYLRFACNGTSLPVLQDYLALKTLKSSGTISDGDIVIPGHTLDVITGSHLHAETLKMEVLKEQAVSAVLLQKHASFWHDDNGQETVRQKLQTLLEQEDVDIRGKTVAGIVECFDWQERQAKFIVNNVRAYERLGFRWRLPMWDRDLTEWWSSVPYEQRLNRNTFKRAADIVAPMHSVRSIPIHGTMTTASTNRRCRCRKQTFGLSYITDIHIARQIKRVARYYYPPKRSHTSMAFEEYFANKYRNVSELIRLRDMREWPLQLKRHFRWRSSWPTCMGGGQSNALLAAYVLKQCLTDYYHIS